MYLEIRPGEGGDDAVQFATELRTALTAYATRRGWTATATGPADSRTLTVRVDGTAANGPLSRFAGSHRIQRIPINDKRGRRQTSTATVAVLNETEAQPTVLAGDDLRIDYFRGSGPGGQHRNKTSSAVRLTHLPTGIVITRTSGRSQIANLADAKADLQGRLNSLHRGAVHADRDNQRRRQVRSDRAAKTFTHNQQRDEVVCHDTGRRWTTRAFAQGRLD